MTETISWALSIAAITLGVAMLIRNHCVLRYRLELNDRVHKLCRRDIEQGREWEWRYKAMESVSYDAMLYRPWKRLDSFYADKSFMESTAT